MLQVIQYQKTGELQVQELPPPRLRPGSVLVRNESSLDFPVAAPAPASDPTAGNKVAAFKQRLRVALSDEMSSRADAMPEHLELLTSEPKWAQRKDTA